MFIPTYLSMVTLWLIVKMIVANFITFLFYLNVKRIFKIAKKVILGNSNIVMKYILAASILFRLFLLCTELYHFAKQDQANYASRIAKIVQTMSIVFF